MKKTLILSTAISVVLSYGLSSALAEDQATSTTQYKSSVEAKPTPAVKKAKKKVLKKSTKESQASAPAPVTPAASSALSVPSMYGPLAANPNPLNFEAGPLGKIYVSGVASGLGIWQNHHVTNDHEALADLSNAQVMIQKTDGLVQFYVQAGEYILPAVGAVYQRASYAVDHFFGPVPIAYVKIAPSDNFSIMAGKLYTLIGTENTFTFQNANIEHGLLWNQTNDLSRGVQVNYSKGTVSGSLALSDGYYSGKPNWLSGIITYTINPNNSVSLLASSNIDHDAKNTVATPLTLDNSKLVQLNYSYTIGAWNFSPTLQYTHVPQDTSIGLAASAATYGAGLTTKYNVNQNWNIAGRAEYIDSTGGTNLVYGPGSNAWSLTLTPTWQQGIYFVRPEVSYVRAINVTPGFAFGTSGNDKSQARLMVETGVLF